MADAPVPTAAPQPIIPAASAPVVAAPAPAVAAPQPVIPAAPQPVVETPVAAPVEAAPQPAVAEPEHPADIPSLLSSFNKDEAKPAAEAKPEDTKPADPEAPKPEAAVESKPEDVKPVEAAPPAKIEWKIEAPEELKIEAPQLERLTGVFDRLANPKDDADRSAAVKDLLAQHVEAMHQFAEQTRRDQFTTFAKTREEWRKEIMADERVGGAGHRTAMGVVARVRDLGISDAKPGTPAYEADAKAFDQFLNITGAGDHPAFIKFMHRIGRFMSEPTLPPPNPNPPPDLGKSPTRRGLYANDPPRPNGQGASR